MAKLAILLPRWTRTLGEMIARKVLVRSQCVCCGMQHRAEPKGLTAVLGFSASPVGRLDRCMVVGCHGRIFYRAASGYGRQRLSHVGQEELRNLLETVRRPQNTATLQRTTKPPRVNG